MGWFSSSSSRHGSSSHHGSASRPSFVRSSSRSSRGSSSYYKRRPRDGFINRLIYKLKHLIRELMYYARRNPAKLFFFVVMPLVSGGVLAGIARQFGIRLPDFLQGSAGKGRGGGGGEYYGSQGYGNDHGKSDGGMGGLGGLASMAGGMAGGGGMGSLMGIAKAFM